MAGGNRAPPDFHQPPHTPSSKARGATRQTARLALPYADPRVYQPAEQQSYEMSGKIHREKIRDAHKKRDPPSASPCTVQKSVEHPSEHVNS